jgi:CubicO group peptidase (beta-lactamase class C family)
MPSLGGGIARNGAMKYKATICLATLLLTGVAAAPQEALPKNQDILFWSVPERDAAFRQMEKVSPTRIVKAGSAVHTFGKGEPLPLTMDVDAYIASQRVTGLIIVQDNRIRLEKYAMGYSASGRWTSFSVAKSFTSTLAGAALRDGYIKSLDDKVSAYIPGLKGSVYDDVTVRQLLTMTSGVKWNEDYSDPKSDVALFSKHQADPGMDVSVSYMRRLKREAPAGGKWLYKTGETNLLGVLVSQATGKKLSDYLSEKIWKPYGMEQDAIWMLGSTGHEVSGCCISAALRDYARFGQFIAEGGKIHGESILPADWLAQATTKRADIGAPGRGYGYQWWTYDDGSFAASGIFGQSIFIDPKRKLVIATNGDWPQAVDPQGLRLARDGFFKAVQAAVAEKP